jgi:hypothetical protein
MILVLATNLESSELSLGEWKYNPMEFPETKRRDEPTWVVIHM